MKIFIDGKLLTQPISAVSLPLPSGAATEATLLDVKTSVQDKSVAIVVDGGVATVAKGTSDGDIIAAPSSGNHIEIYHIYVNNGGANDTNFQIVNGSGGDIIREYTLAKEGGGFPEQLNPKIALDTATALYYNWISGASADINISIHYKVVAD